MEDRHLTERFLASLAIWVVVLAIAGVVALVRWLI